MDLSSKLDSALDPEEFAKELLHDAGRAAGLKKIFVSDNPVHLHDDAAALLLMGNPKGTPGFAAEDPYICILRLKKNGKIVITSEAAVGPADLEISLAAPDSISKIEDAIKAIINRMNMEGKFDVERRHGRF